MNLNDSGKAIVGVVTILSVLAVIAYSVCCNLDGRSSTTPPAGVADSCDSEPVVATSQEHVVPTMAPPQETNCTGDSGMGDSGMGGSQSDTPSSAQLVFVTVEVDADQPGIEVSMTEAQLPQWRPDRQ